MCENTSCVPDELDHHHGERCTYACWSTEPRIVTNATAYGTKPNSRWARKSHSVELVANTILGCSCDDSGVCKHVEHVITSDWRGCIEYNPIDDEKRVEQLKKFTRHRRRALYNKSRGNQ